MNGSRLTGLTCSKAPGFWMVEHQLVIHDINLSAGAQSITGAYVMLLTMCLPGKAAVW